jgi:hypothetical protein
MRNSTSNSSRENPFDLTKASDYSDLQVKDYWVDVASDKVSLIDFLKPTSLMPILLLGGKGSGKTHLMRYCSSTVQGLRYPDLRRAIEQERYLGVYTNADGLNVYRFAGKGQDDSAWETVFAYSFELWLVESLLVSLRPAVGNYEILSPEWNSAVVQRILALMHTVPVEPVSDFDGMISYLNALRSRVDVIVNNSAITRQLSGIEITFNPGELVFGVPKIIAELCPFAKSATFVYLIDEVENFTEQQQRFLNTLVRYRKGNATLRIGARLYGIKTYTTLGSGEPIKRDAEFESIVLDAQLRENHVQYEALAARLILKRLEAVHPLPALTESTLPSQFAELSSEDYYREFAAEIVAGRDSGGKARPHMARFASAVLRVTADQKIVNALVRLLENREHPLLEKVNLLAFYKRLARSNDALILAKEINRECKALVDEGPASCPQYYELYSHFSSDLLAQLCRDYGRKPVYAGFKTLVRLSQGVPRNLLSLLKHIYRRSAFMGEDPFVGASISLNAQIVGVQDAAEWFWEDAQPDAHGSLVRNAVEHLATLLRSIRYSDSPSECDLCCFLVKSEALSDGGKMALKMAENWSFVLRVSGSSSAKNDDRVLPKFQINPMLAARWGISEARRGAIELRNDFAEVLLAEIDNARTQSAINSRIDAMNCQKIFEKSVLDFTAGGTQTGLFDGD